MKSNHPSSARIVRSQHRAARFIPLLSVLAIGLAATLTALWVGHPTFAPVGNWKSIGTAWAAAIIGIGIVAAILWQTRRRTVLRSAAEVDAAFGTQNRLEAVTALHEAENPMARAQREETEQFLQQTGLAPRRRGLTALMLCTAVLAFAHLATLVCWTRPLPHDPTAKSESLEEKSEKKTEEQFTASIEWQSPESEAVATAIEEVPLEAGADSTTGLRDVVLEVAVNGEQKLSQPLKDDLSKPGEHALRLSIYLDQLEVKAYDVVAYHLRAQRISKSKLPPTVSPVQFIQVKPMREDTFICAGGDKPNKCFNYVTAIKASQLRLMKENFTLANAEISKDGDEWKTENTRVGTDQNDLATRTEELIQLMGGNNYPSPILDLVRQSQPLMTEAGGKILKTENQPALAPQGKALGYLTEVEKYLQHQISLAGQNQQPKASDPFQKPKNTELKNRPLTRAAKVEALAKEQSQLAGDLASGNTNSPVQLPTENAKSDSNEITGSPGERQAEIKKRIEELLEDPGFDTESLKHLQSSDELAGKSQEQIGNQDLAAASEPAAEAARELQQTAAALRASDGRKTKNELADALLKLASAANSARKAPQAKSDAEAAAQLQKTADAMREAAQRLEEEARRQEANGSRNNAERLNEMAKQLREGALKEMQAQAQQSPRDAAKSEALARKLDQLADRAAQLRNPGQPSRQELARLIEQMQRTQANLNNLASQCSSPGSAATSPNSATPSPGSSTGSAPGTGMARAEFAAPPSSSPTTQGGPNQSGAGQTKPFGTITHARAHEPSRDELREQFAENLLHELNDQTLDAMGMLPSTGEVKEVRAILKKNADVPPNTGNVVAFAAEINPPLTGLITILRQELKQFQRQHRLNDPQIAQAPPAYRPAVAEYFEELSRDYAADKSAGTSKSK
jgi:hypothetical protein